MSELRPHPSVTEKQPSPFHNEEVEEREQRPGPNWRLMAILGGAATAGAAIAAFGIFGGGSSEKTEPRAEASTSASANPSETASTEPTPEASATNPEVDPTDFKYFYDGETYSYEEFKDAIAVSIDENPTGKEAVYAMIEQGFNGLVNAGCSTTDYSRYKDYWSPDGETANLRAIGDNFYRPAYLETLISDETVAGTSPDTFVENKLVEAHRENISGFKQSMEENHPYKGEFKILDTLHVTEAGGQFNSKQVAFSAVLNYSDNGDQNSYGQRREQPGGFDGRDEAKIDETYILNGVLVADKEEGKWEFAGANIQELNDFQRDKYVE